MGRQDGMLILALAELLNGKLVESRIIEQSLKLLCEAFTFDGALLYELDQYKQMCLKEQYLQFPFSPPEHFVLSELTPAYCELLARQTLLLVSESDQNSADEKVLLTMFGCRSLVVAAVVDEGLSVYGLLILRGGSRRRLRTLRSGFCRRRCPCLGVMWGCESIKINCLLRRMRWRAF